MLILRLVIECLTPLHCGGGEDDWQDAPVTRDAFGYWIIHGSSIAGILRHLASAKNETAPKTLFGFQAEDSAGTGVSRPSLVWCDDALFLDYDGIPTLQKCRKGETPLFETDNAKFMRDHVKLSLATQTAEDGSKFDAEIVPPGARFSLQIRCDGWKDPLTPEEKSLFLWLCGELCSGNLALGGKTALGYGRFRTIKSELAEIDLHDKNGANAWLALSNISNTSGIPVAKNRLPGKPLELPKPAAQAGNAGLDGWLEIPLECARPILIGGGVAESDADMAFALTPHIIYPDHHQKGSIEMRPVLPGSSVRGVLRHAVYDILLSLGLDATKAEACLEELFGYVKTDCAQSGKLQVEDCALLTEKTSQNDFAFVQHVAIDRFTGGAITGALFSEEPFWNASAHTRLRIHVQTLAKHEAALLFHALFDLFAGMLAVGSGSNRGNGRLSLANWQGNPAQALAQINGTLAWNGERIFTGASQTANFNNLLSASREWDLALKEMITHE